MRQEKIFFYNAAKDYSLYFALNVLKSIAFGINGFWAINRHYIYLTRYHFKTITKNKTIAAFFRFFVQRIMPLA